MWKVVFLGEMSPSAYSESEGLNFTVTEADEPPKLEAENFWQRSDVLWALVTAGVIFLCILAALGNLYIWYMDQVRSGRSDIFRSQQSHDKRLRERIEIPSAESRKFRLKKF